MLSKLFSAAILASLFLRQRQKLPGGSRARAGCQPAPLKIVLPGGVVELYYVAVPAGKIMESHPSFIVARPEVFRRPWDSVVHPDEILNPGEKFFLVPRRTVQKLRRRVRKPDADLPSDSFVSQSSISSSTDSLASIKQASYNTDTETQGREQRVRFSSVFFMQNNGNGNGNEDGDRRNGNGNGNGNGNEDGDRRKRDVDPQSQQRMTRRVRNIISWQPSLTAIVE